MPDPSRVPPQDPSQSPTYGLSTNQPDRAIPSSLRRNLFSAHLSRRPVSNTTSNLFSPPSPTHQDAHSRREVFSSGPSLQPTKRVMDLKDIYSTNASPPGHNMSPATAGNLFPRESIIALNPLTGRPLLPNLPTLPARLRLSDDDEDGQDGSDDEVGQHEYLEYGNPYTRSPSHSRNFIPSSDFDFDPDIDLDSSDLNFIGIGRSQNVIDTFIDSTDNDESRRGRERIERLLAEMMNKQRARARTLVVSDSSSTSNPTPGVSSSTFRTTRGGKSRERRTDNPPPKFDLHKSAAEPMIGGAGATMDPLEKDELMGLIMTSLRRKLQQAEDEGWMYGGAEGLGGIGIGIDHGGDGSYD